MFALQQGVSALKEVSDGLHHHNTALLTASCPCLSNRKNWWMMRWASGASAVENSDCT